LGRLVPIWLNLDTIAHRHTAPVPQRRPACWRDARWLGLCANVQSYLVRMRCAWAVGLQGLRKKMRSTTPSRCMKKRSRFGTDSTHWRTGQAGEDVDAEVRRPEFDTGHTPCGA
jgi:hypothetical protein